MEALLLQRLDHISRCLLLRPPHAAARPATTRTAKKIPDGEFKKISAVQYSGDRKCNFFNSSLGCKVTNCKWKHKCVQCDADHPYIGNH